MTVTRCISDISSAVPLVSHMKHKPWKVCLTSIQHSRYSVQFFINIPKHHGNNFILYVKNTWVTFLFTLVGLSEVSIKPQLESEYFQSFNTLVSLLHNGQIASYKSTLQAGLKTTRVTGRKQGLDRSCRSTQRHRAATTEVSGLKTSSAFLLIKLAISVGIPQFLINSPLAFSYKEQTLVSA